MQPNERTATLDRAAAVRENIAGLHARIAEIAAQAGRSADEIQLQGASKAVPPDIVLEAIRNGVTQLGENWVQEAAPKIEAVAELVAEAALPKPTWRMIGHLQRNKTREALGMFDCVDTVDSVRLAETIDRRAGEMDRSPVEALLEIDFTGAPERGGFKLGVEADSPQFIGFIESVRRVLELPRLNVVGLMTVAPAAEDPESTRPVFRRLRELRDTINEHIPTAQLTHLSMGMTIDYHVAIQEGATIVRLGTAIFGPRPAGRTY